jgi:hypothetical protein
VVAGAVVGGVLGEVEGGVVAVRWGRTGNAAAVESSPTAIKATDAEKARARTATTALNTIAGRRLTPNSVAAAGAAVLDSLETRSRRRDGRQDDDVAGE